MEIRTIQQRWRAYIYVPSHWEDEKDYLRVDIYLPTKWLKKFSPLSQAPQIAGEKVCAWWGVVAKYYPGWLPPGR